MSATPMPTERQAKGWNEATARLRRLGAEVPTNLSMWDVVYADEVRPGRGHHMNATYIDGEIFAQVLMDVYGYPSVSWARLEWEHADSDEECRCDPCKSEREDEDA